MARTVGSNPSFQAGFVSNNNEVLDTIRKLALKMCKHKTEEANKK
jgi:hypothetical protein